jgi:uncharacterized protein
LISDYRNGRAKMSINVKVLGVGWIISLLSVAALAATSNLRLVDAEAKRDMEVVRSLLKQHVDVNTPEADGATALAWAAHWDDLEIADLLIAAGAKANAANDYGVTPLSLACTNRSAAMVEKLLKAGADPNAAAWTGETPFMTCARTGNLEAVKSLLARGATVNVKDTKEGQTALMWAAAAKHPAVVQALIEHGADVNAHTKSGYTPLMFAAQQGDIESARFLLAAGARVNEATNGESVWEGDTALLLASQSGHEALSIFLLDHGADPNAADENGITALHFTVMNGLALMSRVRLRPPAPYLVRPNMLELAKALLAHGANPNARVKKASAGDKLLRITGGDPPPGSVSPVGATAFMMAAFSHDASLMRILVAGGADPLLATDENVTPLMVAAGVTRWRTAGVPLTKNEEAKALECVKLAVELGADVNAVDKTYKLTALHGAAFNGSDTIVQFLAEKGANLDAKDQVGQTPLEVAMNIKPFERGKAVARNLVPYKAWKSTADLLVKLGATPVSVGEARGSDVGAATNAVGQ